jgi:hypothetical protein
VKYSLYKGALDDGLTKIGKYYSRLDQKPAFVLALGKLGFVNCLIYLTSNLQQCSIHIINWPISNLRGVVLKEQAAEIEAGNPGAKDWQDEARKIVETTVSHAPSRRCTHYANYPIRWPSTTKTVHPLLLKAGHRRSPSSNGRCSDSFGI